MKRNWFKRLFGLADRRPNDAVDEPNQPVDASSDHGQAPGVVGERLGNGVADRIEPEDQQTQDALDLSDAYRLAAASDELREQGKLEEAYDTQVRALDAFESYLQRDSVKVPWSEDLLAEQRKRTALLAVQRAESYSSIDDENALVWWRRASDHLSSALMLGTDIREETALLHERVLGEAGYASFRMGEKANDDDDAELAKRYWDQSERLLGRLIKEGSEQPQWVKDKHAQAMLSVACLSQLKAREAHGLPNDMRCTLWLQAAGDFARLLARYPKQPEWAHKLHLFTHVEAAAACREQVRGFAWTGDFEDAKIWVYLVTVCEAVLKHHPGKVSWIPTLYGWALRRAGIVFHDAAVSENNSGNEDYKAALWRLSLDMLNKLAKFDPTQVVGLEQHQQRAAAACASKKANAPA